MRTFGTMSSVIAASLIFLPAASPDAAAATPALPTVLQESENVIKAAMSARNTGIPDDLPRRASCIGIFPALKKTASVAGGEAGSGVFTCRPQEGTMGA